MLRLIIVFQVGIALCFQSFASTDLEYTAIDLLFDKSYEQIRKEFYDSAYSTAISSLKFSRESKYDWGIANSLYIQGWCRYKQNKNSEALLLFLEALRVMQSELPEHVHSEDRAALHLNIGRIYVMYSNYNGAHKFYEQGLNIAQQFNHIQMELKLIYNNGVAFKYEGNLVAAVELLIKAKHKALVSGSSKWYFNSINQLGLINKDLERYDSARYYFDQAFEVIEKLDDQKKYKAMIYHNKAFTYFLEGEFAQAKDFYLKSITERPRFISYKDISELYLSVGEYENAEHSGKLAIEYYDQTNLTAENASIFRTVGKACLALGKYEEGQSYIDRYSQEIDKYLETREYTKKLEDAYQIDLLTKQYFLKLEQQKRQAQIIQLSWFFGMVVFAFLLLFFVQRWLQKKKKTDATNAIKAIFNESELLRGSLERE